MVDVALVAQFVWALLITGAIQRTGEYIPEAAVSAGERLANRVRNRRLAAGQPEMPENVEETERELTALLNEDEEARADLEAVSPSLIQNFYGQTAVSHFHGETTLNEPNFGIQNFEK